MQLEFAALSRATGNETYNELAENALKVVFTSPERPGGKATGLFQTLWSLEGGTPSSDRVGTGGASDSFYEYLLKARCGLGGGVEGGAGSGWSTACFPRMFGRIHSWRTRRLLSSKIHRWHCHCSC